MYSLNKYSVLIIVLLAAFAIHYTNYDINVINKKITNINSEDFSREGRRSQHYNGQ